MSAVMVPSIYDRRRIPQKAIDDIIRQIAEKFRPEKIILFGSYAHGDPRPESDVDLLVVMETPVNWCKLLKVTRLNSDSLSNPLPIYKVLYPN